MQRFRAADLDRAGRDTHDENPVRPDGAPWPGAALRGRPKQSRLCALGPAKGALYKPDAGPAPHVACWCCTAPPTFCRIRLRRAVASRFMVLCMNSRFDNNETLLRFETIALDVKEGGRVSAQQGGITKVVLFGHSGGGRP